MVWQNLTYCQTMVTILQSTECFKNPGFYVNKVQSVSSVCVFVCVCQSQANLSDPMDCSLPGSSVHGILQARVLEWVTISFCIWVQYHTI